VADPIAPDRFLGERVGGRFIIEKPIGNGPLSSAFRARDDRLHRLVTVKIFHPQHADDVVVVDAQLELAKGVARLSHRNIATVIDRGEHEGLPFVVLEHVRGENLQERIDRFAPLRIVEVVEFGQAIARALAYAHAQRVFHGNLRPGNVLVSEDREVKLVDFGGGSYVANLTGGGAYVAPERRGAGADLPVEASDDMYALGVLLFVALTEHGPEPGIDASRVQLLRPDVSPRLAAVVARAMAFDPRDRYESMHELASELGSVRIPGFRDVRGAAHPQSKDGTRSVDQPTGLMAVADLPDGRTARGELDLEPHEPAIVPPVRPRLRARRARIMVWSMVLVPVALVGLVVVMLAGERGSTGDSGNRKPRVVNEQPEVVAIAGVSSFDPFGDTSERDELIPNLTDGNRDTDWQTEGYDTSDLVGKEGVGFWVRLKGPQDVREIRISTDLQGWTAQIFGADQPAPELAGWEPVSEKVPVENDAAIDVDVTKHPYPAYLVWITRLALDTDDTNKFRARASEVRVFARGTAS